MIRKWLINTVAVIVLAYVLPGIHVDGIFTALIAALVLGVLNSVLKPILIILTIPVSILTLGLFLLVINAIMVELASFFVPGFHVSSLFWALIFSFGLSFVASLFDNNSRQAQ
jgi:putative membrane protein